MEEKFDKDEETHFQFYVVIEDKRCEVHCRKATHKLENGIISLIIGGLKLIFIPINCHIGYPGLILVQIDHLGESLLLLGIV